MADYVVTLTGKDNLSQTIKQVKSELNSVGGAASKIDQIEKKFDKIQNSTAPLKKQLKDLKAIMADMNLNGLSGTEQFTQIAQYAGKIQDAMQDASTATKRFADDTFALSVAKDGITALAGAGSALAGTLGLVGVESDKVQQAILKVQSAMAILNGVQAVANTLNKDSAMMQAIQAVRLKAVTAATNEATAAQIRNNLAVLTNPYVAAAAAVAALVAGLVYWASTMEDTTQEQETLNAAVDAFSEASEQQSNKLGEQLAVFEQLKKTYDESGGKTDILTNKILNNKEAQRKLGVTLKTVDDVHRLFGKNSDNYIQASISRANALAAEAAQAALLGQVLSELSKIYTKLMKGEEVDWEDAQKVLQKAGITKEQADRILSGAGGNRTWDYIWSNLEVKPEKVAEFVRNVNAALTDEFYKTGAGKILAELITQNLNDADVSSADFATLYENNDKGGQSSNKSTSGKAGRKTTTTAPKKTEEKPQPLAGSINAMKAEAQALEQLLRDGLVPESTVEATLKRIKELKEKTEKEEIRLGLKSPEAVKVKVEPKEGSIEALEAKKKELQDKLNKEPLTEEVRIKTHTEIAELQKQIDEKTKGKVSIEAIVKPTYYESRNPDDLRQSYENAQARITQIQEDLKRGVIKSRKDANQAIEDVNYKLRQLGLRPIYVHIKTKFENLNEIARTGLGGLTSINGSVDSIISLTKAIDENKNAWEIWKASVSAVESVLSSVISVMDAINKITEINNAIKAAGKTVTDQSITSTQADTMALTTHAQAEMTDASAAMANTSASSGEAVAEATKQGAKLPFPYNLVAIAAGVAAVLSAIAIIGSFANGGIVGGSSYSGDKLVARVNSGEMILNKRQQTTLFNAIASGRIGNGGDIASVSFRLRGSDIYGALKNYSAIKGKSGITTGIV